MCLRKSNLVGFFNIKYEFQSNVDSFWPSWRQLGPPDEIQRGIQPFFIIKAANVKGRTSIANAPIIRSFSFEVPLGRDQGGTGSAVVQGIATQRRALNHLVITIFEVLAATQTVLPLWGQSFWTRLGH